MTGFRRLMAANGQEFKGILLLADIVSPSLTGIRGIEMVVEKTVELARSIGLKTLVILSLSSMLGSGLFLLPAFAQEVLTKRSNMYFQSGTNSTGTS